MGLVSKADPLVPGLDAVLISCTLPINLPTWIVIVVERERERWRQRDRDRGTETEIQETYREKGEIGKVLLQVYPIED